ncbi:hypothetical protein VTN77DRAFT_440 [Rasamsonia byssochlamydoides]|uniref:uncharacterized protein n=1 Tax=Rasamsonia byssochlamydoides TaxID=89139 RepID=UPI003744A42C
MPGDGNTSQASHQTSPESTPPGRPENGPALTLTGRTIQACDRCRLKKVRCDGAVPTCGRCQRVGLECLTTVKLNRKSYPRSYTESIEQRLRQLEAEVHRLRDSNAIKDKRIKELESLNTRPAVYGQPNSSSPRGTVPLITARPDSFSKHNARALPDEPLSREVGRMNLDASGVGRFMGSSSGIFFVGTAEQKLARISKPPGKIGEALLRVDIDDDTTQYPLQPPIDNEQASIILPPLETAVTYIDAWFDSWKFLLPILHRPSFMDEVNDLYSAPPEQRDRAFLALFFLVLALGCRHLFLTGVANQGSPTVIAEGKDVDLFCQSSKFRDNILASNDLRTLQFQEVLAMWYLYTGKRSLAFQVTGSMTRLALELGLHRHTRRFHFNPLITELRKRAFWVCYMLDNFLSAIEGLPKTLRDRDIDVELPSDVDDDFVTADEYLLSLPGEPTGMLLFVSLIKVVRILSNTLESLYTTTERRQAVTKIESIDRLLDEWLHNLPDHLHLDPAAQGTDPAVAFLHLTYLYTRFVAHRVAISFQPKVIQYWTSLAKCTALAKEIICLNSQCQRHLLVFEVNPGSHAYTLWSCGLMALYGFWEFKTRGEGDLDSATASDLRLASETCVKLLLSLVAAGRRREQIRVDNLREITAAVFSRQTSSADPFCNSLRSEAVAGIPQLAPSSHPPSGRQSATPGSTFDQLFQSTCAGQGEDRTNSALQPQCSGATAQVNAIDSPGLVRSEIAMPSPQLIDGFSMNYSNVVSQHLHERFQQMPSSMEYAPGQGSAMDNNQSLDDIQKIWDDPVFDLTSMITAASADPSTAFVDEMANFVARNNDGSGSSRKRIRTDAV